jgi:hypothetical protein
MVTEIKEAGRRVRFIRSSRPNMAIRPGETGIVWRVTQFGTRRVLWDDGSRSDLDPKTDDWEVLDNTTD